MHRTRSQVVEIVLAVVVWLATADARADCASESADLRRQLTSEAHRADTWNTAWALAFGAAATASLGVIEAKVNPFGPYDAAFEASQYVGALKAGLGMASRVVLPLRIAIPSPAADSCDDDRALHRAVAKAATKERRSIWLTIIGGTALNLAGSIYLWAKYDFGTGALSFATGALVGPIHAYTQPSRMMRLDRRHRAEWTVGLGSIGATF